jgi:hypothetical protein
MRRGGVAADSLSDATSSQKEGIGNGTAVLIASCAL